MFNHVKDLSYVLIQETILMIEESQETVNLKVKRLRCQGNKIVNKIASERFISLFRKSVDLTRSACKIYIFFSPINSTINEVNKKKYETKSVPLPLL